MSGNEITPRFVKPAGGIEAVRLIPVAAIESVLLDAGCCTGITLRPEAATVEWPILEDTSSYCEETLCPEGVPLVRHTLTLAADPEEMRFSIGEELLARLTGEGVAARIETSSGAVLLAGWSMKFGTEQPLRLHEARYDSEAKPAARPILTLTLVGEDTSPAIPIREP